MSAWGPTPAQGQLDNAVELEHVVGRESAQPAADSRRSHGVVTEHPREVAPTWTSAPSSMSSRQRSAGWATAASLQLWPISHRHDVVGQRSEAKPTISAPVSK